LQISIDCFHAKSNSRMIQGENPISRHRLVPPEGCPASACVDWAAMPFPVLVITVPVGSGKTSVLSELVHLLSEHGVPHAAVELDALSDYFPRPELDPYGTALGLRNLADMWRNFHAAGAERLVVGYHVESRADLSP